MPDIIFCLSGRFIAFEVKNEAGKLSELQEWNIQSIMRAGGLAYCVRSIDEVKKIMCEIQKGVL